MNEVQYLIDKHLGLCSKNEYDIYLKRLVVKERDSLRGIQSSTIAPDFNPEPPIFGCRFAELQGYKHFLSLANEDGRVAIQDTSKEVDSYQFPLEGYQCHNNAVFDVAWVPGEKKILTVSGDHTACLWDVGESNFNKLSIFANHTRSVKTAVFSPCNPNVFATGARDGHVLVWDSRCATSFVITKPDNYLINCHAAFTPKTPASSSKRQRNLDIRATSITGLAFQNDYTLISCGECDGNIKVWDLRKNYSICKREPLSKHSIPYAGSSTKNGYTNLMMDPSKVRLYASCMDNVIYCFNISTYRILPEQRYIGHENGTFYIKASLSPDGYYLVSGSSDKYAYIWNVKYSQPIVRLVGHSAEVTCAAWCQEGFPKVVTCSDDARHMIWKIGNEMYPEEDKKLLKGWSDVAPRREILPLSQMCSLDSTPKCLKKSRQLPLSTPISAKKRRYDFGESMKKTKRCLTDILNAHGNDNGDECSSFKLIKTDACVGENDDMNQSPKALKRKYVDDMLKENICEVSRTNRLIAWVRPNEVGLGDSFISPTKYFKCNSPRKISPKLSPCNTGNIQNEIVQNLPNFVLNGEAPHLRLMSPVKKRDESQNWLTAITKEKKEKNPDSVDCRLSIELSPKTDLPTRRSSCTLDRPPKQCMKKGSLLKYFSSVSKKETSMSAKFSNNTDD